MIVKAGGGGLRRNISSTKWSEDQNVYPIIQGDIPRGSIDKDMHYERTWGIEARKYLRENYYHHIECYVANSLAVLMRKWYLNNAFQEDADGIGINTSNLLSTWRVEMRRER